MIYSPCCKSYMEHTTVGRRTGIVRCANCKLLYEHDGTTVSLYKRWNRGCGGCARLGDHRALHLCRSCDWRKGVYLPSGFRPPCDGCGSAKSIELDGSMWKWACIPCGTISHNRAPTPTAVERMWKFIKGTRVGT